VTVVETLAALLVGLGSETVLAARPATANVPTFDVTTLNEIVAVVPLSTVPSVHVAAPQLPIELLIDPGWAPPGSVTTKLALVAGSELVAYGVRAARDPACLERRVAAARHLRSDEHAV
jgi:hypothetical protein